MTISSEYLSLLSALVCLFLFRVAGLLESGSVCCIRTILLNAVHVLMVFSGLIGIVRRLG